jgi:predicted metal-dependent phosphoesterase TrpH
MLKSLPFHKPGQWYRGNLHTHSTRSDGRLTPEAVCRFYREMGYHFVSITDHFMQRYNYPLTDARACHSADFITLGGAELHAGETSTGELWHILAAGLPYDFAPNLPHETGAQIAARAMQAGAFVAVAHPAWYNLSEQDVIDLGSVHAIETINGISADHNDRIDSWYMLDVMLARGYRYFACATDDAHFKPDFHDTIRGWVWVKSEALTPESILAALKRGEFYSSTGPQIFDLQVKPKDYIRVRCSPASSIFVTSKGAWSVYKHGHGITEAELNIRKLDSPYCRVSIRDEHGGRAWSNPIWLTV